MSLLDEPAPGFTVRSTAGADVSLTDTLTTGPTIVIPFRGYWCSYCAEQLQTFSNHGYDLWRHWDTTILPVCGDPIPKLVEMRDRFELGIQLYSDPELDVAEAYSGIETHSNHGDIPISGTYIIDTDGIVRYEQIAENPADRTYANFARHFIKNEYTHPYE